jgi:hypothetical protein
VTPHSVASVFIRFRAIVSTLFKCGTAIQPHVDQFYQFAALVNADFSFERAHFSCSAPAKFAYTPITAMEISSASRQPALFIER